jgi:Putative prokaryotic signal transducing protein
MSFRPSMKRVHIAPTLLDAQLAADALASLGIPSHILNANAAGALGEVPFLQAQPEIWIDDDAQEARAREALAAWSNAPTRGERICPHCGEVNPANFLSCWQCGGALPDQSC